MKANIHYLFHQSYLGKATEKNLDLTQQVVEPEITPELHDLPADSYLLLAISSSLRCTD